MRKTEMKLAMKLASAVMAVALSTSLQAATLAVADLRNAGDGLLTVDGSMGLAWLDLTQTRGLSIEQVLAGDWVAQGFRLATSAEVLTLVEHGAQIDQPFVTWLGGQVAPADLSAYLGGPTILVSGATAPVMAGGQALSERFTLLQTAYVPWVSEPGAEPEPGNEMEPGESLYTPPAGSGGLPSLALPPVEPIPAYFFRIQQSQQTPASSGPEAGVFLVREITAVPEPSSWALTGLGLLAVGWAARARGRDGRMQA